VEVSENIGYLWQRDN